MKRYKKLKFTLVELMFVVAILVILIGISWVAGTKVLRSQAKQKTKAEIKMLVSAMHQYKERFGSFPPSANYNGPLNFGEYLSKVQPNAGWSSGNRPMFIDFTKNNFNVSITSYDDPNAGSTTIRDPYEQDYIYIYSHSDEPDKFLIYSVGLDGDEETQPTKPSDYVTTGDNADNISSNDF